MDWFFLHMVVMGRFECVSHSPVGCAFTSAHAGEHLNSVFPIPREGKQNANESCPAARRSSAILPSPPCAAVQMCTERSACTLFLYIRSKLTFWIIRASIKCSISPFSQFKPASATRAPPLLQSYFFFCQSFPNGLNMPILHLFSIEAQTTQSIKNCIDFSFGDNLLCITEDKVFQVRHIDNRYCCFNI